VDGSAVGSAIRFFRRENRPTEVSIPRRSVNIPFVSAIDLRVRYGLTLVDVEVLHVTEDESRNV
jgi:hypothetical protein